MFHKDSLLTLSWRRSLSYRNQSIDLLCKTIDWFLNDRDFCHERVKWDILQAKIWLSSRFLQCLKAIVLMLQDATWKFVGNEAKGQISKRVLQENKPRQIFRKTNISYLLIRTRTYLCVSGRREGSFYGNLASFFFLKHSFWDFPFCLFNNELFSKSRQEFQKRIQNPYQATNMELFGKLITWILNAPPYFYY